MSEEKKMTTETTKEQESNTIQEQNKEQGLSETWAQDALADLEDWIEEQGIYIRQ